MLFAQALRQEEEAPDKIEQNNARPHQKGRAIIDRCQQAADAGAEDKANAADSAKDAKVLSTILRLGNIGDIGKEHTKVAPGQPIDDAAQEEQPERATQAKEQVTDRRAKQTDEEDRASTKAIAQQAQARRGNKLAEAIDRNHP